MVREGEGEWVRAVGTACSGKWCGEGGVGDAAGNGSGQGRGGLQALTTPHPPGRLAARKLILIVVLYAIAIRWVQKVDKGGR